MQGPDPIVIGIDPGTQITGYGVITQVNSRLVHISSGCIRLKSSDSLADRLTWIFDELEAVIQGSRATEMALESVFYGKNVRSAILLAHARGVAMLAAAKAGLSVSEYAPLEVKRAAVGTGRATKEQVMEMVCRLFGRSLDRTKLSFDQTDALAVALCHLHTSSTARRMENEMPTSLYSSSPSIREDQI